MTLSTQSLITVQGATSHAIYHTEELGELRHNLLLHDIQHSKPSLRHAHHFCQVTAFIWMCQMQGSITAIIQKPLEHHFLVHRHISAIKVTEFLMPCSHFASNDISNWLYCDQSLLVYLSSFLDLSSNSCIAIAFSNSLDSFNHFPRSTSS